MRRLTLELVHGSLAIAVVAAIGVRAIILSRGVGPWFATATAGVLLLMYVAFACGARIRVGTVTRLATMATLTAATALAVHGALFT